MKNRATSRRVGCGLAVVLVVALLAGCSGAEMVAYVFEPDPACFIGIDQGGFRIVATAHPDNPDVVFIRASGGSGPVVVARDGDSSLPGMEVIRASNMDNAVFIATSDALIMSTAGTLYGSGYWELGRGVLGDQMQEITVAGLHASGNLLSQDEETDRVCPDNAGTTEVTLLIQEGRTEPFIFAGLDWTADGAQWDALADPTYAEVRGYLQGTGLVDVISVRDDGRIEVRREGVQAVDSNGNLWTSAEVDGSIVMAREVEASE